MYRRSPISWDDAAFLLRSRADLRGDDGGAFMLVCLELIGTSQIQIGPCYG